MAMIPVLIRFLRDKAEALGLSGRMLTIGRQNVILTQSQFNELFAYIPTSITDRTLFQAMGARSVESLDFVGTPGADIQCDLNRPFQRPELFHTFDCVFDGGTCEHIFNVSACFETMMKLIKKGGTIVHMNPCLGYLNHGFYSFQPTFYFDLYGDNGFTECEAWLMEFTQPDYYNYPGHAKIVSVSPGTSIDFRSANNTLIIFKARKSVDIAKLAYPIQHIYRK